VVLVDDHAGAAGVAVGVQAGPGHCLIGFIAEISVEARHLVVGDPPAVGVLPCAGLRRPGDGVERD
jgi:hypothetical protein